MVLLRPASVLRFHRASWTASEPAAVPVLLQCCEVIESSMAEPQGDDAAANAAARAEWCWAQAAGAPRCDDATVCTRAPDRSPLRSIAGRDTELVT